MAESHTHFVTPDGEQETVFDECSFERLGEQRALPDVELGEHGFGQFGAGLRLGPEHVVDGSGHGEPKNPASGSGSARDYHGEYFCFSAGHSSRKVLGFGEDNIDRCARGFQLSDQHFAEWEERPERNVDRDRRGRSVITLRGGNEPGSQAGNAVGQSQRFNRVERAQAVFLSRLTGNKSDLKIECLAHDVGIQTGAVVVDPQNCPIDETSGQRCRRAVNIVHEIDRSDRTVGRHRHEPNGIRIRAECASRSEAAVDRRSSQAERRRCEHIQKQFVSGVELNDKRGLVRGGDTSYSPGGARHVFNPTAN
jgi:hypothetical protein